MEQIRKNGCWTCKRAWEDPDEKYTCPKLEQHQKDHELEEKLKYEKLEHYWKDYEWEKY